MSEEIANDEHDLEKIEIHLLLEGIFRRYGYDFRNYSYASIRRRIWHRIHLEGLSNVSALLGRVMHHSEIFYSLLSDLVIPVTEMFRDPEIFNTFRTEIIPQLRELPFIRIWHAGCSTGEEVHSMAILLHEEGILDKTRIYATDISENALQRAKDGIIPIDRMKLYTKNYQAAGGMHAFSDYYASDHGIVILKPYLRRNIIFARHNLVTDRSFNEFHVILCRNVMIYFNSRLRGQVRKLLNDSLAKDGFLILGNKESISQTALEENFKTIDDKCRIFRKSR